MIVDIIVENIYLQYFLNVTLFRTGVKYFQTGKTIYFAQIQESSHVVKNIWKSAR